MRYIQLHHGSYWFQMRVPRTQRAKHGKVVRVTLQTADRDVARVLGTALAARCLARFSQLDLIPDTYLPTTVGEQALDGTEPLVARSETLSSMAPQGTAGSQELVEDAQGARPGIEVPEHDRLAALHEYWRSLSPGRPERTIVEFELTAHSFDRVIGVGISRMTRADVFRYRDHLLKQGLQPATVIKRLGHLSAMVQTRLEAARSFVRVRSSSGAPHCGPVIGVGGRFPSAGQSPALIGCKPLGDNRRKTRVSSFLALHSSSCRFIPATSTS